MVTGTNKLGKLKKIYISSWKFVQHSLLSIFAVVFNKEIKLVKACLKMGSEKVV